MYQEVAERRLWLRLRASLFLYLVVLSADFLQAQQIDKDTLQLEDIVVLASRKSEALMASPTSTQLAGSKQFRNNASPSFFEAIASLRGVQMITPSMGFRIIMQGVSIIPQMFALCKQLMGWMFSRHT